MSERNPRILVIDDEPQILRFLRVSLQANGFEVVEARTGAEGRRKAQEEAPDLIILDLGLPDGDGKDVLRDIRKTGETPILILSAREREAEKVEALDLGADDYVNKPFGMDELMARLRAALRASAPNEPLRDGAISNDVSVDFDARRIRVRGRELRLSPREAKLLRALAQKAGQVLTHADIVAAVWGPDAQVDAQFVRVLVGNLRQKIEKDPARPSLIITEPGTGYRLRSG
jgi:two-component system KDP operon response regulator KdpE